MRTRVKICGITRPEDARAAAGLGVDAIGLVFYAPSPRAVTIAQAQAIVGTLPPFVTVVGLFVDAAAAEIEAVLQAVRVDTLQFHGYETAAQCGGYGRPYIKALRMREGLDVATSVRDFAGASGVLLDTHHEQLAGGTGEAFDWARIPTGLDVPVILAGGLMPQNVAAAVRQVRPYAVDVSGGVEATKGIKDQQKMAAFIQAVNSVNG
ncbi:MAG: phosphoribosylanthranilate isomerase [Gammaproteobacteria bacterium]|nr:phosphoribosylanthranilate isomerase [Gammaproteobacteria bacterium]